MKVISFFSGCGGLDLGFEQAGFHVVWANELEPEVRDTYLYNHPYTKFVLRDIRKLKPDDVPDCEGFIGGPPCQSWSVAGHHKGLEDERGKLFLDYIKMIKAKAPKFFLIENVKGLLDDAFNNVFMMFIGLLNDAGYDVKWQLLDAAFYDVPQNRERVFIVGFRKDLGVVYEFPKPSVIEPNTLFSAIGDIKAEPVGYSINEKVVSNAILPNHDVLISDFNDFYHRGNRRRGWNKQSFTIHATAEKMPLHPSSPKMIFRGHENWHFQDNKKHEYRRLSVRECARIQTFPDSFHFVTDNIKTAYRMVGNAVPPMLGKIFADSIIFALRHIRVDHLPEIANDESDALTIVGYYKNEHHHECILDNRIYYVRSDGRTGSVFKEDCDKTPRYLLLHHKEQAELYELDAEEPVLADSSFLNTLGFECSGQTYLCFRLSSRNKKVIFDTNGEERHFRYNEWNYAPYFTKLNKILK